MKKGRSFMGFELISMEEEEGFKGFFVGFGLKVKFFFLFLRMKREKGCLKSDVLNGRRKD